MNGHEQGSDDESDDDLPVIQNANGHGQKQKTETDSASSAAAGATASSTNDMPTSDVENKRKND